MRSRVINKLFISLLLVFSGLFFLTKEVGALSSDDSSFGSQTTRDPNEYNLIPLILDPALSRVGGPRSKDTLVSNMVLDQGYQSQCAKQDWEITPQVYGALADYFAAGNSGGRLSGSATYKLDLGEATVPLFRGDEAFTETKKSSSFEGFFGANKPDPEADIAERSGVANLLLTSEQQCVVKTGNLLSVFGDDGICNNLEDSDQCYLDYEIAGTNTTTKELFEDMAGLVAKTNDLGEKYGCRNLVQPWGKNIADFGVSKSEHEGSAEAISLMSLNMDRLYRLAFLVIAPEQKPLGGGAFGFLQEGAPANKKHAPIIIAFKIPYVATNYINSLPNLRDASLLSAYSLTTVENIQMHRDNAEIAREKMTEKIRENIAEKNNPVINCEGMPQCSRDNDTQALKAAVIDIINGDNNSCSNELIYEQAGDLGSPAKLDSDRNFKQPFFSEILPENESSVFGWQAEISNANVKEAIKNDNIAITAHIVSPLGNNPESDMEFIANSMKIFFNDKEFARMVEENCVPDSNNQCGVIPEFFTLANAVAELDSTSDSFNFFTESGCEDLPPEEQVECQSKSVGASVGENPQNPLVILGGKIGWMIRKVQESLSKYSGKIHDYITSCERTEDLFLGRCQGYLGDPGGADSSETIADSCNDFRGITVDLPTMPELKEMVCEAADQDSSDAQLLWGLLQIEGGPFLRKINQENATEMSCGDLIINSCGASQIVGILVPQCIDTTACSQATKIANDDRLRKEVTTGVACSIEGSLGYILQKRKSEASFLKETYLDAHDGEEPTDKQLYYMYAARNYGLQPETFVKDACDGAPAVQGCDGKNYCECVMDVFEFSCS